MTRFASLAQKFPELVEKFYGNPDLLMLRRLGAMNTTTPREKADAADRRVLTALQQFIQAVEEAPLFQFKPRARLGGPQPQPWLDEADAESCDEHDDSP